jgi:hypothetical protein
MTRAIRKARDIRTKAGIPLIIKKGPATRITEVLAKIIKTRKN